MDHPINEPVKVQLDENSINKKYSNDSFFEATQNYVLRNIVKESILVPIRPGLKHRDHLFVLNPMARTIFDLFKKGLSRGQTKEFLLNNFEGVSEMEILEDIDEIIYQLIDIEALNALS